MAGERRALGRLAAAVHALHGDEHAARSGRVAEQNVFQLCHVVRDMRRPGGGQLVLRAVAVTDADGIHAVRLPALDVKAAVADHHDAAAEGLHAPADKRRLAGILVVQPRPDHIVQIRRKAEFLSDALGENLRLRGDNRHARAVLFQAPKQRRNAGIYLVFRPADALKALVIVVNRLIGLLLRHADDLSEGIIQRRADEHLELLLRKAGEAHLLRRVNRGLGDALLRLGERSVQIKKNRRILHRLLLLAFSAASGRGLFPALRGFLRLFAFSFPARRFLFFDFVRGGLRFLAADQRRDVGI